jgi:carbon monoxide dehydrogenase subunit G
VQLQQTFEIPSGADRVWAWFKDIESVVGCLPGASLRAPPDNGKLQLAMVVKLGPITANFVGEGEARFDDASHSGSVQGAATDRKSASRIKGQVDFALTEVTGTPATRVALTIDYSMGGTLAQFSREGIVRELAQRLTDTFAANLRRKLEAAEEAAAPAVATMEIDQPEPADAMAPSAVPAHPAPDETLARPRAAMDVGPEEAPLSQVSATLLVEPAQPASLNFGALLWVVIVDRLRRWIGMKPKH